MALFLLREGDELQSESGKTYLAVNPLGQNNVWTAVDRDNYTNVKILKLPSKHDSYPWPRFVHEMIMHEFFKDSPHVRKQVGRICPSHRTGAPPMLVLEMFETTVWHARMERPFSRDEIVAVMRGIFGGLQEVHAKGLVYGDLKMENIMLNGFNADIVSDGSQFEVKLGDLGTVSEPFNGTVQPVAYRAPEVFFREEVTAAADIWAAGLIYSHLLEARTYFNDTGLYDDMRFKSSDMQEQVEAMRNAIANDYDLCHVAYYNGCALPLRDEDHAKGSHWMKLWERGLDELDIEFLERVLKADPRERPSARAILGSQWFTDGLLARKFAPMEVEPKGVCR